MIISTTVDQATQAQRMIRDIGGPIGVRSALGVGTGGDIVQDLRLVQQSMPHVLCGTPQKLHALFTSPGGISGSDVRFLVLDEVDQLIARNLHEFVFNIVKLFPPARTRPLSATATTLGANANAAAPSGLPLSSPMTNSPAFSPFDPAGASTTPFASPFQSVSRRFSTISNNAPNVGSDSQGGISGLPPQSQQPSVGAQAQSQPQPIERQTALFSNTVPQDVLNLANAIDVREPVRVLVRRDGNVTHADTSNGARGLRQFYLYLAFYAGGAGGGSRAEGASTPGGGLGIIGSGRSATTNAETNQAREWKLDALADLFDDLEVSHAIVHVGGSTALENVVYKLSGRGLEAVPLVKSPLPRSLCGVDRGLTPPLT